MMIRMSFFLYFLTFSVFADNIIANGTRFIYPENEKEITIQLTNKANRPAVVQSWLDNGDPKATPDTIKTPFLITPPVSRVDGKGGQTLRIKLTNAAGIARSKESLWWLNLLEIPPTDVSKKDEGQSRLQLAIRSRFKFIYRPKGLGDRDAAPQQLAFIVSDQHLLIKNPTPFYITLSKIINGNKKVVNKKTVMLTPQSQTDVEINTPIRKGETLVVENINDYGASVTINAVTQ